MTRARPDPDEVWTHVLVDGWGPLVRDAVVAQVEDHTLGRRGMLVRGLREDSSDPWGHACVEQVHALVLAAIRAETGADLDELGSQAAWACYEDAWDRLRSRWEHGGDLVAVPAGAVAAVRSLLQDLPVGAAEHAGADIGAIPVRPLVVDGAVRVDRTGLLAWLATERAATERDRQRARRLLDLLG